MSARQSSHQAGEERMPRTIGIIGAGPVGGILAAHLSSAGHTVILVDAWKEQIEKIRAAGLHIIGRDEMLARPAHLLTSIGALDAFSPEFVFICTKACDLDTVAKGNERRAQAVECCIYLISKRYRHRAGCRGADSETPCPARRRQLCRRSYRSRGDSEKFLHSAQLPWMAGYAAARSRARMLRPC